MGKAWFGLAWFILGLIEEMGRKCRAHSVGSSGVSCIGSLLAFLLRFREKCFYDILNTCHNSPPRQVNVLSWRKFTVPAPVHLALRYWGAEHLLPGVQLYFAGSYRAAQNMTAGNALQSQWQPYDYCTWAAGVTCRCNPYLLYTPNYLACWLSLVIDMCFWNSSRWGSHQHSKQNPPGTS